MSSFPLQMLLVIVADWIDWHQLAVIDYLREENRIIPEPYGKRRLRFTDDQRRRLLAKGKVPVDLLILNRWSSPATPSPASSDAAGGFQTVN